MELAFELELAPLAAGFVLVDQARAQVGIDRQLLAWHRVEREARRDLGDALGALGDDDELHHGDDEEHHQPDDEVAAGHHLAEGVDDVAGMGVQQDHARRRDRQRQPEQRRDEQHAREHRELQRRGDVDRHQQQRQADCDVDGHQHVDEPGRQRQHHQRDDRDDAGDEEQVAEARERAGVAALGGAEVGRQAHRASGRVARANAARSVPYSASTCRTYSRVSA